MRVKLGTVMVGNAAKLLGKDVGRWKRKWRREGDRAKGDE